MAAVSIIVPIYNTEKYLDKCIKSIINQTLEDIEIILVNDGSTDSSLEICQEYAAKDDRIKIIDKVNEGSSYAKTVGIQNSSGKYFGFVDSDDYIETNMFETLYSVAEARNADLVGGGVHGNNRFW